MDIFAIGLAAGAPAEQASQTSGEPGFDVALQQVITDGFIPPGGPPGPEPPPDILSAGEEVKGTEPIALPNELDFHPQEKIELDVELPQPFWEAAPPVPESGIDEESDSKPIDQAMEWLSGQMFGGFFATPLAPVTEVKLPEAQTTEVSGISFSTDTSQLKILAPQSPFPGATPAQGQELSAGTPNVPKAESQALETPTAQILNLPEAESNNAIQFNSMVQTAAEVDAPEVLTTLNVSRVQAQEAFPVASTPVEDSEAVVATERAKPEAVSQALETSESHLEAMPALLRHAPTPGNKETSSEELDETASKAAVVERVPQEAKPIQSQKESVTKTPQPDATESTALQTDSESANAETGTKDQSDKGSHFGQQTDDDSLLVRPGGVEASETAVIETVSSSDIPLGRPERVGNVGFNEAAATSRTTEAKAEPLQPGEVDSVVKQLSERLHMLAAARPRNGVTIHLNPQDLGEITVVVKAIGRQVDTMLSATDQRVREALDQNQDRLVDAMNSRGFNLQSVSVSQQSGHSTQHDAPQRGWQQSSQQQSQNQSGQSQTQQGHRDRPFEQPKNQARNWTRRQDGVDLSI
jgi:flagellar hook-length control protein FliK